MIHDDKYTLFNSFIWINLTKYLMYEIWNLTFYTSASVSSHNLSCAVSCPNIFVLNTNETVLPAAFTASSCEKFTEVIPWFGDKLGLSNAGTKFRNISPTPSVTSLPPLPPLPWKKQKRCINSAFQERGRLKKSGNFQKTRKNVLVLGYANIEAQFTIIIQTDSQVPLKLITIIQPFKW